MVKSPDGFHYWERVGSIEKWKGKGHRRVNQGRAGVFSCTYCKARTEYPVYAAGKKKRFPWG